MHRPVPGWHGNVRFGRFEPTDNFHFFTELAQRIIKAMSFPGPMGRLYQVDMRLRPTGRRSQPRSAAGRSSHATVWV